MPPSNPHSQQQTMDIKCLHDVIDSSTPDRLRALLKSLSAASPVNYNYVRDELVLKSGALKRAWSENNEDDSDSGSEDSGFDVESDYSVEEKDTPLSRRRFEICVQCEKEYDVLLNNKKSCRWHDGEQEVDWHGDFWADHDERCHGTIDSDEMRIQYPEGFVWSCCDELGNADGCKTSRHRPNRAKRVKK